MYSIRSTFSFFASIKCIANSLREWFYSLFSFSASPHVVGGDANLSHSQKVNEFSDFPTSRFCFIESMMRGMGNGMSEIKIIIDETLYMTSGLVVVDKGEKATDAICHGSTVER